VTQRFVEAAKPFARREMHFADAASRHPARSIFAARLSRAHGA
jgi:hypothetical protein